MNPRPSRLKVGKVDPVSGRLVVAEIGSGATGTVYRVRSTSDRQCETALKVFRTLEAFKRETSALERVGLNEGVVRVLASHGVKSQSPMIEYEYSEVGDLYRYWEARGKRPFTVLQTATIMRQIVKAVDHLHVKKILHCDLKPSNILCFPDETGHPMFKLCDLGSARPRGGSHDNSHTTGRSASVSQLDIGGYTLAWAAPEVVAGAKGGVRSDIYSLGIIWYQLLMNEFYPGTGQPLADWVERIQLLDFGLVLRRVIGKCIATEPSARYVDASKLVDEIDCLLGDWYEVVEHEPSPEVVTSPDMRTRILATGLPWRVVHRVTRIEMLLVPPPDRDIDHWYRHPAYLVRFDPDLIARRAEMLDEQAFYLSRDPVWHTDNPEDRMTVKGKHFFMGYWDFEGALAYCDSHQLFLPTQGEWDFALQGGPEWTLTTLMEPDRYRPLTNALGFRYKPALREWCFGGVDCLDKNFHSADYCAGDREEEVARGPVDESRSPHHRFRFRDGDGIDPRVRDSNVGFRAKRGIDSPEGSVDRDNYYRYEKGKKDGDLL